MSRRRSKVGQAVLQAPLALGSAFMEHHHERPYRIPVPRTSPTNRVRCADTDDVGTSTPEPHSPSESRLLDQFKRRCQDAASASLDMGSIGIEYIRVRMALSDSISRDSCTA